MAAVLVTINAVCRCRRMVCGSCPIAVRRPVSTNSCLPHLLECIPDGVHLYIALLVQAVIAAAFVFLGQAGTNVERRLRCTHQHERDFLFIPYLLMFAALVKLEPGPVARFMGSMGFLANCHFHSASHDSGG